MCARRGAPEKGRGVLRRCRSALVGPGEVVGVEDAERHPEEEVDDPAEDRDRGDEAEHDRIHETDEEEDDDRDDPGTPPDPSDMRKDRTEVERLAEAVRVGESHDREERDERYDDPDDDRNQEPGDRGGNGRGPYVGVVHPIRRYGGDDCNPPEVGQDQDHRDHVDPNSELFMHYTFFLLPLTPEFVNF